MKKAILIPLVLLVMLPLVFADLIAPTFEMLGIPIVILLINYMWNFFIVWAADKTTKRKYFNSMRPEEMFNLIIAVTFVGIVADLLAMLTGALFGVPLSKIITNIESAQLIFIITILTAFVFLVIVQFIIFKKQGFSGRESGFFGIILGILANPAFGAIIVFYSLMYMSSTLTPGAATQTLITTYTILLLVFGLLVAISLRSVAKNQDEEGKKQVKKAVKIILALAIIALVLSLIPTPPKEYRFYDSPKDAISSGLAAVKNGGEVTTQEFTMKPDTNVQSTDFTLRMGLDRQSIVFSEGDYAEVDTFTAGIEDEVSYVAYSGFTEVRVKAKVICEATGERLEHSIEILNDTSGKDYVVPNELCVTNQDFQPCCAVILRRP